LIATATALTAESIALGIRNFVIPEMRVDEVFVSGGGAHNPTLLAMLRKALGPIPVMMSSEVGLDVDAKEAVAFAVMAYETAHARPSNVPKATGAKRPVVLGKITQNTPVPNVKAPELAHENGAARNGGTARNGVIHNGNGAGHKVPARKAAPVNQRPATTKVKAAVR
jgi:anhydro-N-acetylmuramic acid kinase